MAMIGCRKIWEKFRLSAQRPAGSTGAGPTKLISFSKYCWREADLSLPICVGK